MLNIVVLVSGGGTNLQAIIDAISDGRITNGKIVKVISSKPNVFALERAKKHNIETCVVARKEFNDENDFCNSLFNEIKAAKADIIVLAGFLSILGEEIIKAYPNKIINVHPALIPSFCGEGCYGLNVHKKALEYGVKVTGATVHFVNEVVDGGAIIAQKCVKVLDDDTPEILQQRVMEEAEWELLPYAVNLLCNDKIDLQGRIVKIKE